MLKLAGPVNPMSFDMAKTLVIGGLQTLAGLDEVQAWMKTKLWDAYGPQPVEVYLKGDFRGVAFAKFSNTGDRDEAVKLFQKGSFREGGNRVWAKPDQPLEQRILNSFAFGLKYLFKNWGYPAKAVWADPEVGKVWLGDDVVAQAFIDGRALKVEYGPGWEVWLKDAAHPEFPDLLSRLNGKIGNTASKGAGKAGGKGKAKSRE